MLEKELVSLICVACAAESRELPHRPETATIAGGMDTPRVRVKSRHAQRFRTRLGCIERRVNRLDFFLRVRERDVAQLAFLVLLPPLSDFLTEQAKLGTLLFNRGNKLVVGCAFGAGALEFGHFSSSPRTSSPLCRNN